MIWVIFWRRVGGRSGSGVRGWFLLVQRWLAGRFGGGASTVISTWSMGVGCCGRPLSRLR
jgi:hypothetical protein